MQIINYIKLLTATLLVIISWNKLKAQTSFQAVIGNTDYAYSVVQDADGSFLIAGYTWNFGLGIEDCYVAKLDSNGNMLWSKTYGSIGSEVINDIQIVDNGYIMVGSRFSIVTAGRDIYMIKTSKSGNLLWSKIYGGMYAEDAYSVEQTTDKGFILAGGTTSFGIGQGGVYLLKTDSTGNLLWSKTYSGTNSDGARSVQQTLDGGFIIAGSAFSNGLFYSEFYLLKTDSIGNLQWTKTFGGSQTELAYKVVQTIDSGYAISGYTYSFGSGLPDYLFIKTDKNGNLQWSRTFGSPLSVDKNFDMKYTSDGGYILAGKTWVPSSFQGQGYVIKLDSLGTVEWSQVYGDSAQSEFYSVFQNADGGYVFAGWTNGFVGSFSNMYIVKTDSLGRSIKSCYQDTFITNVSISIPPIVDSSWGSAFTPATIQTNILDTSTVPNDSLDIICCLQADFSYLLNCLGDTTLFTDFSVGEFVIRYWDYGDGSKDTFLTATNAQHYYLLPDTYLVTLIIVDHTSRVCVDTIIKEVIVYLKPIVSLGNDTAVCPGQAVILNAGNPGAAFLWSTTETLQTITIDTPGIYIVQVTVNNCTNTDTLNVGSNQPFLDLGGDTTICDSSIILDAGDSGSGYLWSTGASLQQITVSQPGLYSVVITKDGCENRDSILVIEDCESTPCSKNIFIPNAFTPNGDNQNDVLYIYISDKSIELRTFMIFNRWGDKVFETKDINTGWDGTFNNRSLDAAVFVYYLEVKCPDGKIEVDKGDVTLIK